MAVVFLERYQPRISLALQKLKLKTICFRSNLLKRYYAMSLKAKNLITVCSFLSTQPLHLFGTKLRTMKHLQCRLLSACLESAQSQSTYMHRMVTSFDSEKYQYSYFWYQKLYDYLCGCFNACLYLILLVIIMLAPSEIDVCKPSKNY